MNVRRLMSDNKAVRRRNKGPHGNRVANGQTGPANGGAMVTFENEAYGNSGMRVIGSSKQLKDDIIHEAINESASAMNSDSEDEFDGGINFGANPHSQQISTLSGPPSVSHLAPPGHSTTPALA